MSQQLKSCPAQQPRPGQVEVAKAPVAVECQVTYRRAVHVPIPVLGLRRRHRSAAPAPCLLDLVEGAFTGFRRRTHSVHTTNEYQHPCSYGVNIVPTLRETTLFLLREFTECVQERELAGVGTARSHETCANATTRGRRDVLSEVASHTQERGV